MQMLQRKLMERIRMNTISLAIARSMVMVGMLIALAACGSGSGPATEFNPVPPPPPASVTLVGSVGDGPLTGSTISVSDASGEQFGTAISDAQAMYSLELSTDHLYPLELSATAGLDAVTNAAPTITLESAVINAGQTISNLTPHTTMIVNAARALDAGITSGNLAAMNSIVQQKIGFGHDSNLVPDSISAATTPLNSAHIIKASEALAEMIRRTTTAIQASGTLMSEDELIQILSGDISDGQLDGLGPGANARFAAIATIESARILLETMRNELQVNGADASAALDAAILLSSPSSTLTSADVPAAGSMLTQAIVAIQAAQTLSPSTALDELVTILQEIPPGSAVAAVRSQLPADAAVRLDQARSAISAASIEQINAINDVVRNGGPVSVPPPPPPLPPPPPPVVNGQPVLLYSDLVAGPSGAFVTVWGQNIPGDAQFICGNQPCEIISFGLDPNHPAHGNQPSRQKLVVRFNSGSGITLNGFNTLPYETNNGSIHEATPGPIGSILDSMNPGDVLYLREGSYNVNDGGAFGAVIWADNSRQGLAVIGYPGERVVLDISGGLSGFDTIDDNRDWTIANMECDGGGSNATQCITANRRGTRTNLRVVGMYSHDTSAIISGAFGVFGSTQNVYVLGNFSENTGVDGSNNAHVLYHVGQNDNDNVNFDYNRIRNHVGGRAIQIFGHTPGETMDGLRIRYNDIENIQGASDAILVSHSDSDPGSPPSSLTRAWINDALIQGNTARGVSRNGVSIRAAIADVIIDDNVIFDIGGPSIFIDFVKTARIANNCLDEAPQLNQTSGVTQENNRTDYPNCLD